MYLRLTFINAGNKTNEIVKLRKYSEHVMVFSDLILVVYIVSFTCPFSGATLERYKEEIVSVLLSRSFRTDL